MNLWGASLEVKQRLGSGVMGVTQAPPRRHFAIGADIRGIDQDLDVSLAVSGAANGTVTYDEDLDTRYYGAYAAWGGDYTPFLFSGIWRSLGLQSSFQLRGGVYHADTDYDGRLIDNVTGGAFTPASTLSLSNDEVAFIGGLVLETSKRIGPRAMLSLKSEYEYYSYVPEMAYNQTDTGVLNFVGSDRQAGTVIKDDDAFSMRTSVRLTIKLGPDAIMEPQ